jgi:hypothetical protein
MNLISWCSSVSAGCRDGAGGLEKSKNQIRDLVESGSGQRDCDEGFANH